MSLPPRIHRSEPICRRDLRALVGLTAAFWVIAALAAYAIKELSTH